MNMPKNKMHPALAHIKLRLLDMQSLTFLNLLTSLKSQPFRVSKCRRHAVSDVFIYTYMYSDVFIAKKCTNILICNKMYSCLTTERLQMYSGCHCHGPTAASG